MLTPMFQSVQDLTFNEAWRLTPFGISTILPDAQLRLNTSNVHHDLNKLEARYCSKLVLGPIMKLVFK